MNKKEFLGASLHTGLYVQTWASFIEKTDGETYDCLLYSAEFDYPKESENNCTPILRPLSDLTKPITHNGETFVPVVELAKIGDTTYDKLIISNLKFDYRFVNLDYLPVWIYRKLIEWHFNLMDESEPFIPVTDEFNPYK